MKKFISFFLTICFFLSILSHLAYANTTGNVLDGKLQSLFKPHKFAASSIKLEKNMTKKGEKNTITVSTIAFSNQNQKIMLTQSGAAEVIGDLRREFKGIKIGEKNYIKIEINAKENGKGKISILVYAETEEGDEVPVSYDEINILSTEDGVFYGINSELVAELEYLNYAYAAGKITKEKYNARIREAMMRGG